MKVKELLALEPKLEVYELKPDGRYLICLTKQMPFEHLEVIGRTFAQGFEKAGVKLVGLVDFVPRIFELEPEQK